MPIYEYQCDKGHVTTDMRSVDNRRQPMLCEKCKQPAEFAISAPATPVLNPARPVKRPKNM